MLNDGGVYARSFYRRIGTLPFFNTDGEIEAIGRWKGGFASEGAEL